MSARDQAVRAEPHAHGTPPAESAHAGIAAACEARFGRAPVGVWSAPGRVNLIGEHTDYNDGFALPFAIGQRTYAALAPRDDGVLRVASTAFDGDGGPHEGAGRDAVEARIDELADLFPDRDASRVPEWAAYPLGVAWALAEIASTGAAPGASLGGYDLLFASEVPLGAGLSSSAALECATATALDELWGIGADRRALARVGRRAENEAVGAPTGIMDQIASLLGEPDHAVLIDSRDLSTELVPLHFAEANLELLVIDTRVRHAHASGGYRDRRASCERGAHALGLPSLRELDLSGLERAAALLDGETFRRVRHIVTENDRVLRTIATLEREGARAIGPLLTASHESLRDDFEISVPELDLAVDASIAAGALGARMTGGGFGGAAIALIDVADAERVQQHVLRAFDEAGWLRPDVFAVAPRAGAGRS